MLFNSFDFAIFYVVVTVLYFALPHGVRWLLLLMASCAFYMAFVPVYILILFLTIIVDYMAGMLMEDHLGHHRKFLLIASIVSTCAILFVFKYFNFVNGNIAALARTLEWNYSIEALTIALPIGLSFHTFQSLSYVVEVYRGSQKAERHFGIYSLYVMFYPQLVAGPIERPQNLLHQFHDRHDFNASDFVAGLKLMSWGFFKKLVVADRLSLYVNRIYNDPVEHSGPQLILATVFFAYQIYCDFSGYSDIAIGAARTMGIRLMKNFDNPYASQSISEFWRRWHISLSTWFKDYVYVPLGGSRTTTPRWYGNLLITFTLSGIWHGANWTFVLWGLLNGIYLVGGVMFTSLQRQILLQFGIGERNGWLKAFNIVMTFILICLSWILFRARNLTEAEYIFTHLLDFSRYSGLPSGGITRTQILTGVLAILALEVGQFLLRSGHLVGSIAKLPTWGRWSLYYSWIVLIVMAGVFTNAEFIYFQF